MAARYFIPTSGEYAWTGSVWAATATGAAGSAATPVDGDDVYILSGTARITSALDQSAIQLNSLTIGFSGEIGTSASSLQIGLDTSDSAHIYGNGTINIAITQTSGSILNVYDDFGGILNITGGAILNSFFARNGTVNVSAGTLTNITTWGCAFKISGSASIDQFIAFNGLHNSSVNIATVDIRGQRTVFTMNGAASSVTNLYVQTGATYIHASGGTISNAVAFPFGRLVTRGSYGGFTVSNSSLYSGGSMFEQPSVPITYTNATNKYGFR